jgi:hypothetical protein
MSLRGPWKSVLDGDVANAKDLIIDTDDQGTIIGHHDGAPINGSHRNGRVSFDVNGDKYQGWVILDLLILGFKRHVIHVDEGDDAAWTATKGGGGIELITRILGLSEAFSEEA